MYGNGTTVETEVWELVNGNDTTVEVWDASYLHGV